MIWDAIMAGAAVVALAVSLIALRFARRDARDAGAAADRAVVAAERSASAAATAAEALTRSASVAEREEASRSVAWQLTRTGNTLWQLENVGTAVAKNLSVTVRTGDERNAVFVPPEVRPSQSVQIVEELGSGPRPWVMVEWQVYPENGEVPSFLEQALPY